MSDKLMHFVNICTNKYQVFHHNSCSCLLKSVETNLKFYLKMRKDETLIQKSSVKYQFLAALVGEYKKYKRIFAIKLTEILFK